MNKLNLTFDKNFFRDKRVRFGGYAALITIAAVVVFIVVNLIFQQLHLQADMTDNKMFTLSTQTKRLLESLENDVTIYGLYKTGQESTNVVEVINKYEKVSKKVNFVSIDPDKNPVLLSKYDKEQKGLMPGSLIVESNDFFRIISAAELYDVSYTQQGQARVMGFKAEQRITDALLYVTSGYTPKIYQLTGHGEFSLLQLGLQTTILKENYELEELNLLTTPNVPEDADIVLLLSPEFDLSEAETEALRVFLENDGSAMFFLDFYNIEIPMLNSLLASYGVEIKRGIVMESDRGYLYNTDNPYLIAPKIESHEITQPLLDNDLTILMPFNMAVQTVELLKREISIVPLLRTSGSSWNRNNLENSSLQRSSEDEKGPFDIVVAIRKKKVMADDPEGYRLIVSGNAKFLGAIPPFGTLKSNLDFFLNGLAWLNKRSESISIRSKSLFQMPLQMSGTMQLVYAGIFVVLIPLGLLIAGLVVWLRRRHL